MPTFFTLEPLVVGVFPAFPLSKFLHGWEDDATVEAPCLSWLGRGDRGELVLVDTGPPVPTAASAHLHTDLDVRPEHRIDEALRARGIGPEEVTAVVFTHLHYDHCAYGELLPEARFFVQRAELQYAVAPDRAQRTGYETGVRGLFPGWMRAFDRIEVVDGDTEIAPGVGMLSLPGHTPGSAGAVFDTRQGRYAVAGDLVNQIENWEGAQGSKHVAPSRHSSLDDCMQSFAKLERHADVVLASHDFRMLEATSYPA